MDDKTQNNNDTPRALPHAQDSGAPSQETNPAGAQPHSAGFEARPAMRANIQRRIFSVPKEGSGDPYVITPSQADEADIATPAHEAEPPQNLEKTRRIPIDHKFLKRPSFSTAPIAQEPAEPEEMPAFSEQLMLEGFAEEDVIQKTLRAEIHEQEMEEKLRETRREKAKDFSIGSEHLPPAEQPQQPLPGDIFQISVKNRRAAYRHLHTLRKKATGKLLLNAVIGLVLLLLPSLLELFHVSNPQLSLTLQFFLLLIALGFDYHDFSDGLRCLRDRRPNAQTGIFLVWITVLIQNIAMFTQPVSLEEGIPLYNAIAVLLTLPFYAADFLSVNGAMRQLHLAFRGESVAVCTPIADKNCAHEMGKGVVEDEPLIAYNARTLSLNNFIANALADAQPKGLCKFLIPACAVISLLMGIYAFLDARDPVAASTALACTACATMPVSAALSMVFALRRENEHLAKQKSGILSYEAADSMSDTNCVVFSSEELFPASRCNIHGIVPYNKMRLDESIFYAAATVIKSGGPLADLFTQVVQDRRDLLPGVESLVYEEKLGLSAWIDNKKALVGTLEHLRHHNVKLPEHDFYSKHCIKGRKPLFLAVEGVLCAMFVVSYRCEEKVAAELKTLTENAVTLLLHTCDPNITGEFVEDELELSRNTVKVMNQKTGEYYRMFRYETQPTVEAENFHDGSALSFLQLLNTAFSLQPQKYAAAASALIASVLAFALCLVFLLSQAGIAGLGNPHLLLYHIFWCAAGLLLPKIFRFINRG